MGEPAFLSTCGNPSCKRVLYVMAVVGRQDILCGKCKTVTEFHLEGEEKEGDYE